MYTDRKKYLQEVEKLKTEVRAAQVNTRGNELDNVQKAMQILMEEIVEPLRQEVYAIRKELTKFRRAVEKANGCRLSDNCPVRNELQKSGNDDGIQPVKRQPAQRKRIRADTAARRPQRGEDYVSYEDVGDDTGGHRL